MQFAGRFPPGAGYKNYGERTNRRIFCGYIGEVGSADERECGTETGNAGGAVLQLRRESGVFDMGVKVQDFLIENRAELLGAVEEAERYGSIAARQTKKERDREYYCKYYALFRML